MTKQVWLNLPIKEQERSREFYSALGFTINDQRTNDIMLAMSAGTQPLHIMLFDEKMFDGVIHHKTTDTSLSNEMIISFDAESREEVEQIAEKVNNSGGNVFAPPAEIQGWMYGCAFTDPDGHRWNALYMDMSKMPK